LRHLQLKKRKFLLARELIESIYKVILYIIKTNYGSIIWL